MRLQVFFILSLFLLECQSLSLTMNRDAAQGHCSTIEVPPTSESAGSCKAPTKEKDEVAVVTIEDPSSSFFVHFRGDKKKDDSVKNYCGKPILSKKATGLDAEGIPLKKVIIKRESSNDVKSPPTTPDNLDTTQEDNEALVSDDNTVEPSDVENAINSEEDAILALDGSGHDYENGYDNIANQDYIFRALSGILGLYRSVQRGVVRLYSMTDSVE